MRSQTDWEAGLAKRIGGDFGTEISTLATDLTDQKLIDRISQAPGKMTAAFVGHAVYDRHGPIELSEDNGPFAQAEGRRTIPIAMPELGWPARSFRAGCNRILGDRGRTCPAVNQ